MEGLVGLTVILFLISLAWFGWEYFKRIGWLPQTRVIDVHISGDWLTGEFRACQSDGLADVLFCPKSGESQSDLAASGQAPRSFSVSFHGNLTRKPKDILNWKCERETESINCSSVR